MLTPQLLETFPYYQYADYKTIQRGQQYFRDRRVYDIEYFDDYAVCQVEGNSDDYEVIISLTGRNKIRTECTCPYGELGNFCKRMVASMLALTQYLESEEVQDDWQYQLSLALQNAPRRKSGGNTQHYVAIFLLQKDDFYQRVTVTQISETDIARSVTVTKMHAVGQVTGTDFAQSISSRKITIVSRVIETDIAQTISIAGGVLVGQVIETDAAQAINSQKIKSVGQPSESDAAQAVGCIKTIQVQQVIENDLAQALFPSKRVAIAQVIETDTAMGITEAGPIAIPVGQVLEIDLAQAIAVGGVGRSGHVYRTENGSNYVTQDKTIHRTILRKADEL